MEVERVSPPTSVVVREIIETLLLTLFIFWIVNTATGRYRVQGHSMMPTLEEGEYLIINKLSYYLARTAARRHRRAPLPPRPQQGIHQARHRAARRPGGDQQWAVVTVNGVVLDEPYLAANPIYGNQSWTVPPDQYFVMGDNRNNSSDSRDWSFLPRSDIVGKAALIYWGVDDWGLVPHYAHPQS
jgi:signal peptidase I